MSYQEIGKILNLSHRGVIKIEERALKKIKVILESMNLSIYDFEIFEKDCDE